jgi:hypothetical protein
MWSWITRRTFSEVRVALAKERVSAPAVVEVLPSQEPM